MEAHLFMPLKDTLIGLFIVALWGFNFVVIAWGLDDFPPFLLGASRFILIALLGSLFLPRPSIPWRWMALYALTIGFGQFALLFWAMEEGMPAGLASLVLQSQAIFSIIFASIWLKESARLEQILALSVACIGLFVIGMSLSTSNATMTGFVLSVAAASCWALGNIVNRQIANKGHKTDVGLVVWSSWFAVPPFIAASLVFEGQSQIYTALEAFNWQTLGVVLYLSVGASMLGFGLWGWLLSKYPASQVTPLSLGVPIFGFISAAFFLGEQITPLQGAGIVLVLLCLLMNSMAGRLKVL